MINIEGYDGNGYSTINNIIDNNYSLSDTNLNNNISENQNNNISENQNNNITKTDISMKNSKCNFSQEGEKYTNHNIFMNNSKCNNLKEVKKDINNNLSVINNNTKSNNNILEVLDSDEFYKINSNKLINDNKIKSLVYNNIFANNNFIKDLKNKKVIKSYKYPYLNEIIKLYYLNYTKIINQLNNHKYYIYIFNIIYIILLLFILLGFMLPHNLLIYHILISVLFLISLENNKDPINIILNYFYNKNINLIPFNNDFLKNIIIFIIIISFSGLVNKKNSIFSFLIILGNKLLKYH